MAKRRAGRNEADPRPLAKKVRPKAQAFSPACEDDGIEPAVFASPPCSAAEVDPVYMGPPDGRLGGGNRKRTR